MDRARHVVSRLSSDEFHVLFELAAAQQPLKVALNRLGYRNKTTAARAYGVVSQVLEHGVNAMSDEDADQIASRVGYATTQNYVQNVHREYFAWHVKSNQLVDQARRQKQLEHFQDLRQDIGVIGEHLPFPEPEHLDLLDLSAGSISPPFGSYPTLLWEKGPDGAWLRNLDPRFEPIVEHLETAGNRDTLQLLAEWQRQGGLCIERCHLLRHEIKKRSEIDTGMARMILDSNTLVERGLWGDYSRTIYMLALGHENKSEYMVASHDAGLDLLSIRGWSNLAWVLPGELADVQATHQALVKEFGKSELADGIRRLADRTEVATEQLLKALVRLSEQPVIPGTCSRCLV